MPQKKLNLKTMKYKGQNLWDVKLFLESGCDNNFCLFALRQSIRLYPLQHAAYYLLLSRIADITLALLHFHQANSLCKDVDPIRARKSEVCNCCPRAYHPASDSFTSCRISWHHFLSWKHSLKFWLWIVALKTVNVVCLMPYLHLTQNFITHFLLTCWKPQS